MTNHVLGHLLAEFQHEGIQLNSIDVIPRKAIGLDVYKEKFPLSKGKIPGLAGPGIEITETVAVVVG